jgi:hypothetical protein
LESATAINPFSTAWKGSSLTQPAVLLPCQYPARSGGTIPELALVAAILEDAVRSLSTIDPYGPRRRQFIEARDWLLDDDRTWPFGFRNVCDLLGIEPTALRKSIGASLKPPERSRGPKGLVPRLARQQRGRP